MNKKLLLAFGVLLILSFAVFTYLQKDTPRLQKVTGTTMGTIVYNVKYMGLGDEVTKQAIDAELEGFNQSLSTYISDSEISSLNDSGTLTFQSKYFLPVLQKSAEVYDKTDGTFDPSIGPLVRSWGFGPDKKLPRLDSATIDSLRSIVGFEKVTFDSQTISIPKGFSIDFSAIAKGYAVDLVGELLEASGIEHYLVEIGGEVRCRGTNEQKKSWSLGIEDPTVEKSEQRLLAIVRMKDRALATSGNYRNYYEKEGKIYAHIIDPRTGYNAQHSLLSASVFAADCMTADAYATAFMVLGLDASKEIVERENLDAFLVFRGDNGELRSFISKGIEPFVELNKAN